MRVGFGQIHRAPGPNVAALMRRGMGQTTQGCAQYLASVLASYQAIQQDGLLTGTPGGLSLAEVNIQPGMSPTDAADQVYSIANGFCQRAGFAAQVQTGLTLPSDCSDGGEAAAAAAYPQWLAFYNSLPAGVWQSAQQLASQPTSYSIPLNPTSVAQAQQQQLVVEPSTPQPMQVQTAAPTPVSVSAPAPAPAAVASSVPAALINTSAPVAASAPASTDAISSFFTETIDGIPNWVLIGGGLVALLLLPSLLGGRR